MAELVVYTALHAYKPSSDDLTRGCIAIEPGDDLEVKKPFDIGFSGTVEKPDGWIRGRNTRTDESGYFPGTFVKHKIKPVPKARKQSLTHSSEMTLHDVDSSIGLLSLQDDSGYGSPKGRYSNLILK
jgi:hypothetical protein